MTNRFYDKVRRKVRQVVATILIVCTAIRLYIFNFIQKHFLKVLLYFCMYILPLLLIVCVYHLNEKSKCPAMIFMYQLKDANKTNYRLNETREFSIQGISKFRFVTLGENKFMVIYSGEKIRLDAGRKK